MPRNVLAVGIVLWITCAVVHAQGGAQPYGQMRGFDPNAPTHDVSGSVINAATGEPIPRALVQMFGPSQRSDFTDSQGNFRFEGVPEGQAVFTARKPGFYSSEELARGGGRPRSPVKITSSMSPIVLQLTPEGIVTGTITGDDGEPLEGVRVRLKHQVVNNGRKQWEERQQSTSNEDGEFRVANLVPGTYNLFAEAQRPATPRAASEQNLGYAPAYYPGAPDASSAAPIEVRGGQTVQLDFRLRTQPVFEVSGVVTGIAPGQRGVNVQFMNRSGDSISANVRFNPDDGTFSAKPPAGTYTVRASSFEQPRRTLTASALITVAANVSGIRLPLQPGASIPIVVRTDFTKQQSSPISGSIGGGVTSLGFPDRSPMQYASVQLIGLDNTRMNGFPMMERAPDNASFALQNVEPGRYAAQISPHGPWYVQSATYGQTDLLREDMVVAPGDGRPIEITLRDDGGSIAGSVTSDNVAATAIVLAVPERRSTPPQPHFASENGFTISLLAPGDYLLFAFDSTDGLEYTNREALEPYASRATRVSVSNNSSANVTLTLIKRGAP
ncbi:MAG: carboxypeptidase-like regulatory domain-containing protein [Acidobacteriia bacterium]|nr:carboxypeptidase-like regulatory domain-containing protein [Terriglobia bacterium]